MVEVVHDEKLLMHFFQDSLSGAALSWYMRLDNIRIRNWKDLVDAFVSNTSIIWILPLIELVCLT